MMLKKICKGWLQNLFRKLRKNSSIFEINFETCQSVGNNQRATLLSAISGIAGIPGIAAPSVYQEIYQPTHIMPYSAHAHSLIPTH